MTGAGISTESGLGIFRSDEQTGIWSSGVARSLMRSDMCVSSEADQRS